MRNASAFLLALSLVLTTVGTASGQSTAKVKKDPNRITAEELAEPAVAHLSAYEAIQRLRPIWLRSRAKNTFGKPPASPNAVPNHPLPDGPDQFAGAIINNTPNANAPLSEFLSRLQASEIAEIEFLSGSDATTRYGTGYPNGAIVISTMTRR